MAPAGTEETICRIVEEYSGMLLRLACTRLGCTQDAEDAVQEVFLSLLSSKPVFRDAGHEKAWLIRATLHRASDIRRRAEKRNIPLETMEDSPAQVAEHTGNTLLAQAFESGDAVLLNETVESGGYQITLSGLVSGAGLSQWTQDVEQSHTYAVVGIQRTDGEAITQENFDLSQHTLTPLVSGYSPPGGEQLDPGGRGDRLCPGRRILLSAGHPGPEPLRRPHGVPGLL